MDEPPARIPLRTGSHEDYTRVVAALTDADFTEATICRALKLHDLSALGAANSVNTDLSDLSLQLELLIKIFLFFEPAARTELEETLGSETLEALLALGILHSADDEGWGFRAAVFFYPVAGYYVASDSMIGPDDTPLVATGDWLLPAIFSETLRFLSLLPTGRFRETLDLGTGTGIAAMALARSSERAVAVDITQRSVDYARFNCELNGCENVEVLHGDLYGPVHGRTFDRIVAHPPYIPVSGEALVFRDAGETGEEVGRRIIEGLPTHLRPGGAALILMRGFNTAEAPFEVRATRWLGAAAGEFEVAYARLREDEPLESVLEQSVSARNLGVTETARMRQMFTQLGARNFAYGVLTLRRS